MVVNTTIVASEAELSPLKHTSPGGLWYKALSDVGYGFGPHFQKQLTVESITGQRKSRSHVYLAEPPSAWSPQSPYPMHPACIDGCFQTVTPSLWSGDRSAINAVLVPAVVDNLLINPVATRPELGVSVTSSEYIGRGRKEESKNYLSNCSVYDPDTGSLLLQLSGLRYHKLDTGERSQSNHVYNRSVWRPDVTFLSQAQLPSLEIEKSTSKLNHVIDLIAHKKPGLKVMEVNLSLSDTSSIWFEVAEKSSRSAYLQYLFISADPNSLISVQAEYEGQRKTAFSLLDMANPDFTPSESGFDLVIIKRPTLSDKIMQSVAKKARSMVSAGGYVMFVEQGLPSADSDSDENDTVVVNGEAPLDEARLRTLMAENSFHNTLKISCDTVKPAYLCMADSADSADLDPTRNVNIVRLSKGTQITSEAKSALQQFGWQATEHCHYPYPDLRPKSIVVILDELSAPLLVTASEGQWKAIKHLITQGCKILWITEGSQYIVTKPDNALVHGFFRTIRAEDPSLSLTTLDVESCKSPVAISAIDQILRVLQNPAPKMQLESEFVERGGIIHVNRILPDDLVNRIKINESRGAEPELKSLHDLKTVAMLRAERLGTLDALQYSEITVAESPVKDNNVEVEIYAAGLNFKDVAVTMGIVPENEHLLGLEGAGIVRRVGQRAGSFKVGDRVAIIRNGTFANRIQVPTERTHLIPDSLTFEEAATIPLVYLTSLYSLSNVANLRRGQSVLIHSASGGVGISCIQLAQYFGAEIYVTVGTEEKRRFLTETFGIPLERMFSSRTTKFASQIMQATQGKGIDVIMNSLTGDLLDESWRICAAGGTMVEIGKKDIIDRNHLSMEPFDRNCSFRPVDFSHKQVTDTLIAR